MSLKLENVSKTFVKKKENIVVLDKVSYEFEPGKFYAIIGHSGGGKSTLIKILGLLLDFQEGKYLIDGRDVQEMNETELALLRREKIGFVFQDYFLDPYLKAYENVMVPMVVNKKIQGDKKELDLSILDSVGLLNRANHFPKELSGGEQQRVAIARAMVNDPKYILADEPTGNLDRKNEKIIFEKLKELSNQGKGIIVVSHSMDIFPYADVVLRIEDGLLEVENAKVKS